MRIGTNITAWLTRSGFRFFALVLASAAGLVWAQDEGEAPVTPRPAEIMPKAADSLLLDVDYNGRHFVAVGDRGDILYSNDGREWVQVPVPVRATLTAVDFVNEQQGWAVGHDAVILHTEDGGRNWTLQMFEPDLEQPFLDVLFVDARHGYAIGAYGMFYVTDDAGLSWEEADAPAIRDEELHFNGITRLNDGTLFVAGESTMLGYSRDGLSWVRGESPYEGTLFGALPYGERGVLVYGMRGNVLYADDPEAAPEDWTAVDTGTVSSFFGGAQLEDGGYVLVGLNGDVLYLDAGAGVRKLASSGSADSLADVLPLRDGLLTAGMAGVKIIN